MLIIIAATVLALAFSLYMIKSQKTDPSQLREPRGSLMTVGVQIICGDCSGDDERPVKTYLDRFGNCGHCGGHSYELAANRAVYAHHLRAARLAEYDNATNPGRVIPFESPSRSARADKIAV
ncbi:MAG TPA: hypothetical protein VNH22_08705 [Blastocatellia bacterium]|jgi:Zn finger protein HypA/HybF involved in hydrogenase expression|nr:hypothetical protein [Blastocatellia bacterium]